MKILHIAKRYPNSLGGDAVVVRQLVKHQRMQGNDVYILTTNCKDIMDEPRLTKVGLPISSLAIDKINFRRIVTLAWMIPWSFWYLRKIKPEIIHSHTMDFGYGISFAARFYHIPMVNTCHGVSFVNPKIPLLKRRLELFFLKHAGYKITLTVDKNSLSGFATQNVKNVRFIPNAVDIERFHVAKPYTGGRFEIFFVGRIERAKGIGIMLDAVAKVKETNWRLRLVSPGNDMELYKKQAQKNGISAKVEFLGRVMPLKNAELHTESHIFLFPSLHEGFPIALLEAWAAGLPVIITKVGTVTTVCEDGVNALLIAPGSVDQMVAALERLMSDKNLRERLAKNGRALVEKMYTYEILTAQIMEIYKAATA